MSLCTFYCIKNKLVLFPCGTVLPPTMSFSCSRRYNHPVFRVPFARCNGFKYSFSTYGTTCLLKLLTLKLYSYFITSSSVSLFY